MNMLSYCAIVIFSQLFFWLLYVTILRNAASHGFSRFFLLASLVGSFFIPLLEFQYFAPAENPPVAVEAREIIFDQVALLAAPLQVTPIPEGHSVEVVILLMMLISALFFLRFLHRIVRIGSKLSGHHIRSKGLRIFRSEEPSAYSFFHFLFVPDQVFEAIPEHPVILHEAAHAQHLHSVDRLLTDFIAAIFWFDPIIRLYKRSLVGIHEFQADAAVIEKGIDHIAYQHLILNAAASNRAMVSHFQKDLIKRRIMMINSEKRFPFKRLASVLTLSLLFLGIMSFRAENMLVMKDLGPLQTLHAGIIDFDSFWERPSIFPVDRSKRHRISSHFGNRKDPWNKLKQQFHSGLDITIAEGSEVYATADGVVSEAHYYKEGYGNKVTIKHEGEEGISTSYAHLKSFIVVKGEKVKRGDVIGYVGSTGKSTAPHLHYAVCKGGKFVDPINFFEGN